MQISLKAARINANVTIEQAAKAVGVSCGTIRNWEIGTGQPGYQQFRALCKLYGVDTDTIK